MPDIYLNLNDAQQGPFTAEQLQAWVRDGTVVPDTLSRQEGMAGWQPLSTVVAVAARPAMPQRPQPYRPVAGFEPKAGQEAVPKAVAKAVPKAVPKAGFNRLKFFGMGFLALLLIGGVFAVAPTLVAGAASGGSAIAEAVGTMGGAVVVGYCVGALLALGIGIWLGVKRLQNIGWHGALILLMLVPGVGLFLGAALIALPPAYARTKELDGPAWTWIVLIVLLVGLPVIAALVTEGMRHIRELQVQPPPAESPP